MRLAWSILLCAALAACGPSPDFYAGCVAFYLEEGVEEPCNTPEVVFGAEDVLLEHYSEKDTSATICDHPVRLYKPSRIPRSSHAGRYNGLVERGEVHIRLLGPNLDASALYHEWFAHTLPIALEQGTNWEHSEPWAGNEKMLTAEIHETKDLYPVWCETSTTP